MFTSHFYIARRHLSRHKGYFLLNTFGLGTGIGCALLIVLYVSRESTYDRFHVHNNRIYRVVVDRLYEDGHVRISMNRLLP